MEKTTLDDDIAEVDPKHSFLHPYQLCGVIKSKTEFYVRHSAMGSEELERDPIWWHIEYKYKDDPEDTTIDRNQTTINKILDEINELDDHAILVYANEAAFAPKMVPLSAELNSFVTKDNMNFQQEVADERARFAAGWNDRYDESEGKEVVGNWFEGDDGWTTSVNPRAEQGYLSSKTLTPDMDVAPPSFENMRPSEECSDEVVEIHLDDEKRAPTEMLEINSGSGMFTGGSNASSETVGRTEDLLMVDANAAEPKAEHVEFLQEKKGT